jgi:hypothetical protein
MYVSVENGQSPDFSEIFTYENGALKTQTNKYKFHRVPVVSPDAQWVAYTRLPDSATEDALNGHPLSRDLADIYLQNVATGKTTALTTQPKDVYLSKSNNVGVLRSQPAWSPSGRQLAWTELPFKTENGYNVPDPTERLVIYDLDLQTSRTVIEKLPEGRKLDGVPALSELAWGLPGIAVLTRALDKALFPEVIRVYTVSGDLVSTSEKLFDTGFQYSQLIWLQEGETYYVSNIVADVILDPLTGKPVTFEGFITPELFSPLAPNEVSLFYGDRTVGEGNPVWLIGQNGEIKTEMAAAGRYYFLSGIALSPDGKTAAFVVYPGQGTQGGLYIYRNGSKLRLNFNGVTGVAWGPVAWRIKRNVIAGS